MLISVIVPVYKVEPYLRRCVDSVLNQTYSDLELVLVDDGSPDNSGLICEEYAASDPRVRVLHKENGGVSSARNAGLDVARGQYIAFLDSDDWYHPQTLELLSRAAEEFDADGITMNNLRAKTEDVPEELISYEAVRKVCVTAEQICKNFNRMIYSPDVQDTLTCGMMGMYRAKCFEGIRFDESIACGEDVVVLVQLNLQVSKVVHLDAWLYYYYIANQSATRSGMNKNILTVLNALTKMAVMLEALPEQEDMMYYRYLYCYFDLLMRVNNTGDENLRQEFNRYRPDFLSRQSRLRRISYLSSGERLMLWMYAHELSAFRILFEKLERKMLAKLDSFLEEHR